jgi:hypothetical protein
MIRRREFIAGLGSAAAWPLEVFGQERSLPVVAFIGPLSPEASVRYVGAFRAALVKWATPRAEMSRFSIIG